MSILGAVLGGVTSLIGSSKAASAQKSASRDQTALARETRDLTREDLSPFVNTGYDAQKVVNYLMGIGSQPVFGASTPEIETIKGAPGEQIRNPNQHDEAPRYITGPGQPDTYRVNGAIFDSMDAAQAFADQNSTGGTPWELSMTPASQFLMQQGRDTMEAGAASRGGLYSGATLQGLEGYRQNIALSDRENQLNRLMGMANSGQNAAAGLAAANQNYATQAGNALANAGNASAAGWIGGANAINSAIGNAVGYQQFNKLMGGDGGGGLAASLRPVLRPF